MGSGTLRGAGRGGSVRLPDGKRTSDQREGPFCKEIGPRYSVVDTSRLCHLYGVAMTPEQGARLRKLLERQRQEGETWDDMARRLGVTRTTVMNWMAGTAELSPASLQRLASEFGMTRAQVMAVLDGDDR